MADVIITEESARALAAAILYRAALDVKIAKPGTYLHGELHSFFGKKWFVLLCESLELEPDTVRKKMLA